MDFLLLRCQGLARGRDAGALLLKLVDPTAQRQLTNTQWATGFDEAVVLLKYEVGSLAFKFWRNSPTVAWSSDT